MSVAIEFDSPTGEEFSLVFDAWIQSFRKSPWAGVIRNDMYVTVQRATIVGILDRGAHVTMALAPRVEGVLAERRAMGFAVHEHNALHYLYVKKDYRRLGVAGALLARISEHWNSPEYTHRTRDCRWLPKSFHWNPVPARTLSSAPRKTG